MGRREDITMAMFKSLGAILAIAVAGIALTLTTAGLLSMSQTVPTSATITTTVNVGVYSDNACTQNLTSIEWGSLSPGDSVTRTIYVKNTGIVEITLSMTKTNWNPPSADGPITLTWNREDRTLDPGQSIAATLTLSVSPSISGITAFGVNVVITGTG